MAKPARHQLRLKRAFDVTVAALLLALLAIPFLGLATLMLAVQGVPLLFRQQRPGLKGRPFTMFKLRTMQSSKTGEGDPSTDAARITWLGRILRQTSIDELPELINVIRGEMSLVGPRPLMLEYLPLYTPEQARRHEMRPGMTGWAQVNGRNAISWEEKFALDVLYVDNWSFWFDLKILALTATKIFATKDTSAPGHATMPKFTGTQPVSVNQPKTQ
jgi:lipopolysaccharide/colanic/teichoic acid biosynthesis glycosyltransferase